MGDLTITFGAKSDAIPTTGFRDFGYDRQKWDILWQQMAAILNVLVRPK